MYVSSNEVMKIVLQVDKAEKTEPREEIQAKDCNLSYIRLYATREYTGTLCR